MRHRHTTLLAMLTALMASVLACRSPQPSPAQVTPLRLSEVQTTDNVRRASLRLCAEGLREDLRGKKVPARSQYERAMRIDPTNPWAYLVMARHEAFTGDASSALEFLEQAETLLGDEGANSPRVAPHLDGLRGAALDATSGAGRLYLDRAAESAPDVWGDGRLDPDELL